LHDNKIGRDKKNVYSSKRRKKGHLRYLSTNTKSMENTRHLRIPTVGNQMKFEPKFTNSE